MKKLFYFLFAIAMLLVLSSCSKDDEFFEKESVENDIVGKWTYSYPGIVFYYEFKGDSAFNYTQISDIEAQNLKYSGKYSIITMEPNAEKQFLKERLEISIKSIQGAAETKEKYAKDATKICDDMIRNIDKQKSIYLRTITYHYYPGFTSSSNSFYTIKNCTSHSLEIVPLFSPESIKLVRN